MKSIKSLLVLALLAASLPSCFLFRGSKKKTTPVLPAMAVVNKPVDSIKKNPIKSFREVVTAKFTSDTGFLNVHFLEDRYYLEIPEAMLNRDIMTVSRLSQAAAGSRVEKGAEGFSGSQVANRVINFSKGAGNKIYLHTLSYTDRATDTTENGMGKNLLRSSLQPISAAFDIKSYGQGKKGFVIDVSDYLLNDQSILGFNASKKRMYGLGSLQKDKSYVLEIQSFPINLEIRTQNTYVKGEGTATYQLSNSWTLLPEKPMRPRISDGRVGYFNVFFNDFDAPQGVKTRMLANRFRLEPKPEDIKRYLKGELVEPLKPIVYYIDPATPKKWVKHLIAGVNDWQKAFEQAGFKNAIYALEAPVNNEEWSLYDARHNAILYLPSAMKNAMGPHIHDPRSGEIIETHISWYHNVMNLLHEWYMVQAGPNDPRARRMEFDEELMGQLIRFVSSHEVGHTLGLKHNFIASSTVPVDSLRNKKYLEKNGFCPSIMDYARFNYVAQPEDNIPVELLMPRINDYDKWAIEWGYRWFPEQESIEDEAIRLDKWVTTCLRKNNRLSYTGDFLGTPEDPRVQVEDLGDNAMKANTYGIENLKIVMRNLREWARTPGGDYTNENSMRDKVVSQFTRYVLQVSRNISLYPQSIITESQGGSVLGFVTRKKKKEALAFLNKQLFETPRWLIEGSLLNGPAVIAGVQERVLSDLMNTNISKSLEKSNERAPEFERYRLGELLSDLSSSIWGELKTGKSITAERRHLQRIYVEKLITMQYVPVTDKLLRQDIVPISRSHIGKLISSIDAVIKNTRDQDTKIHLEELVVRLRWSLKPESYIPVPAMPTIAMPSETAASCCTP